MSDTTRLSRFEAARVIAQRDFRAILFSRAFLFFLLGPLFPIIIGVLAGGIGGQVQRDANTRLVAVAMSEADTQALIAARARLAPQIGRALPELAMADAGTAPEVILREPGKNYVAVVGGTLAAPELTAPDDQCVVEHASLLQVGQQPGDRLVHLCTVFRMVSASGDTWYFEARWRVWDVEPIFTGAHLTHFHLTATCLFAGTAPTEIA